MLSPGGDRIPGRGHRQDYLSVSSLREETSGGQERLDTFIFVCLNR